MVVKAVVNVPAALHDIKNAASDEQWRVVEQTLSVGLQKLVLFFEQREKTGIVKILRHLLKRQYVGRMAEVDLRKMQITVVYLSAPYVMRHYPYVGSF